MGVFDTVYFTCPNCKAELAEQFKVRPGHMFHFNADDVPGALAQGIHGCRIECYHCNERFIIESKPNDSYSCDLVSLADAPTSAYIKVLQLNPGEQVKVTQYDFLLLPITYDRHSNQDITINNRTFTVQWGDKITITRRD